jgi:hypothetical protein
MVRLERMKNAAEGDTCDPASTQEFT